ncbi:hypothetical protein L6452_00422 [Arctium lappa]|uniref:Uncharacterized protein n=1 Tax=Arctium lappa TaxID=4217 RepID=A0ACB9FEP0_ARCLA|nr:hypothetical protein L6452_00422 [Arctium lappa]
MPYLITYHPLFTIIKKVSRISKDSAFENNKGEKTWVGYLAMDPKLKNTVMKDWEGMGTKVLTPIELDRTHC